MTGPLNGIRIVELGAIGPAPFAGMMLADMGAEVIRVGRIGETPEALAATHGVLNRGRRWMQLDLKSPEAVAIVRDLAAGADVFTEGFRPGVAERLGLGPNDLLGLNPQLVYGRMTGWGQDGPLAARAGHDLNYIARTGALQPVVGADGQPVAPLNMLGDFGGGGMLLAVGVLAALHHARSTGQGQVVDAAIVDGTALLTAMHQSMMASGAWGAPPRENFFDGGAPFYRTYRTADDQWLSVGAIEPQFYQLLVTGLGIEVDPARQLDQSQWPALRTQFAEIIASRPLGEWLEVFGDTDACVAPVLSPHDAVHDPHLAARATYTQVGDVVHPSPAPRFSATPTALDPEGAPDQTATVLRELGRTPDQINDLRARGVCA